MIQNLWSTPFLKTRFSEETRNDLLNYLLVTQDIFNSSGDLSNINVLDDDCDLIQSFKNDVVLPTLDSFLKESLGKSTSCWKAHTLKGWLTGSGKNYVSNFHNHKGAAISAIFYLMCEEVDAGGEIYFTDPRQNANRGYDNQFNQWFDQYSFTPKSGDVVVFPSFLYHYVATYRGNIRIAMPVDLFLYTNN
jgi:hypothetical protein